MDTLVIFGNCQAVALAAALPFHPAIADRYELVSVPNYGTTAEREAELLNDDVRARCTLLMEQVTPLVRLSNRYDFPRARITTFPSLDFNLLWPLHAAEPRSRPEPPDFPYGRYPYGDRIINQVVAEGRAEDDAWREFKARSETMMPNLKRLAVIEEQRWKFAERKLDVVMSDVIFPHYRQERLFWTYNHPNRIVLCRMGARLVAAAGLAVSEEAAFETMIGLLTWEFGADFQMPVHPRVGRELELAWWREDMLYRRYDDLLDYEAFVRNQIIWN